VTWNLASVELETDEELPEGRRFIGVSLSEQIDARFTGIAVYGLPPGEKQWPYHWHLEYEEFVLVVAGEVVLRTPEGERVLRRGDVAWFPAGPAGAHTIRNDSAAPARFAIASTQARVRGAVYPDSGKIGFGAGGFHHLARLGDPVSYWEGEV
jgi:uncharacterized cupin superfamily protein